LRGNASPLLFRFILEVFMKTLDLTDAQKEKHVARAILVLGVLVTLGRLNDSRFTADSDWLIGFKTYLDPLQYMIGLLGINLILLYAAIKKHDQIPNPILNYLKWSFALLFIKDFLVWLYYFYCLAICFYSDELRDVPSHY